MQFLCNRFQLDLSQPKIMGILNVTPDSFSDGGRYLCPKAAVRYARKMLEDGADILDIGGESTRPGAEKISVSEELRRVVPVVEALLQEVDVPISIDTSKPEVMQVVIDLGVAIINDVSALQAPGALEIVKMSDVGVCLMHMQRQPSTMQHQPEYQDVVRSVAQFLHKRVTACEAAGIARQRLLLDPGFGFGKTFEHNVALFQSLGQLSASDLPLLVGVSRKSLLGEIVEPSGDGRQTASVVAAVLAVMRGARIVRVHDVKQTKEGLQVAEALNNKNNKE